MYIYSHKRIAPIPQKPDTTTGGGKMTIPASYYEISLHGEYVALDGDKKILKPYTANFKLPHLERALGDVLKYLLSPYLKKRDPNYIKYVTHIVDGVSAQGRQLDITQIPIRFQSREQLKEYVKYYRVPVRVEDYEGLGLLRDHIRLAQEEPERYKVVSEKYKKKREFENDITSLNVDVLGAPDSAPAHLVVAPKDQATPTLSAALKAKKDKATLADDGVI
jgi:hypothetical protein